jgi:hypothetical protein
MCHSTENLLNYYETSLARASDDFYPKVSVCKCIDILYKNKFTLKNTSMHFINLRSYVFVFFSNVYL